MSESGNIIQIPIEEEVKTSYLNYAMSVIVSRALPDVRDGLKPVHRRLLFAMEELGLRNNAPTKKSARITGDAMGKYHPHGDLSLYDALVRMAQDFSLRYPLVQGQGNFGSIDGDPPAASRYTEAKLSKIGEEMLADLDKETVDFVPNYDESLKEPSVLPSAIPNLLINGSSGIAVGMATNMPPHNLREVAQAIEAYIENPDISIDDLMNYVKGPDFPTGGIIYGMQGIRDAYATGRGRLTVRGRFIIETMKSGREQIVFTEIPYALNKTTLVTRIAELVRDKQIDGISDLRDESDRDGIRIVLELKKGAITKIVLNQLFIHTPLQSTFGVINLALVNGAPKCLNLKELITYYVQHRFEVVTRRSQYELKKAEERAHILRGLVIALQNIDEVVAIIKASRNVDTAKTNLRERFGLSDAQAQAIVDMRLGRLTSLETEKLLAELKETEARIEYLRALLADSAAIHAVIKKEIHELAEKYGDERRTEIVPNQVEQINIEDLIKPEEMVILISNKGFIKRISVNQYRSQGRGGKGSNSTSLLEDDFLQQLFIANTHDYLLFISSWGKAYWLKALEIPEASRQARGSHIRSLLAISQDEEITAVVDFSDFSDKQYILMGTLKGVVKKVATKEFANAKTRGIIGISLDDGDRLVSAILTGGTDEVMLISRKGLALRMQESQVRQMGRTARGVRGLTLQEEDELAAMLRVDSEESMLIITQNGYGKRVKYDLFTPHSRGTRGQIIYEPDESSGEVIKAITVREEDEVMVITSMGKTIKLNVSAVRQMGKAARGVRIVNIDPPDLVIGMDKIVQQVELEGSAPNLVPELK
ncbi:DNA gyrase subunit A [uncultured spirochete]|uniref:DNA gyrase subunit A n=2 Tax=Spirochaetales TaxID=136 RepID=A0A3P3XIX4_9SPIR|nr:DNA topoisomerase (ATP-hydrolyzing) subunit A [Rectinema subterraneum]SLM13261.1 DNA gyrase subunit A [uncultured spirochete]